MSKPKKWTEVYPQGTKDGDDESKFFKALARHPKWDWRSTGAIMKGSGLSRERVEELIDKYTKCKPPLVYASPKNEDHWGYWERKEVSDIMPKDDGNISKVDKNNRIDSHLDGTANAIAGDASASNDVDDTDDDIQDAVAAADIVDDSVADYLLNSLEEFHDLILQGKMVELTKTYWQVVY